MSPVRPPVPPILSLAVVPDGSEPPPRAAPLPRAAQPGPERIASLMARETERFAQSRPASRRAHDKGRDSFLGGLPMHWMADWPTPFPMIVARAEAARLTDLDGFRVDDFCLGDTASMFGHAPAPVARAIRKQAERGLTTMLPGRAAYEAGAHLTRIFGDFRWQVATTATDANRYALRVARAVTGRPKVLVFNGCYHGTVDDTMVALARGRTVARAGLVGQVQDLRRGAICVEFNDLAGVEAALASGEVAAILTEPVMTNSAMVLPAPGFLAGLRDLATRHGALLIIDETHTLSTGFGGYTRVHGLDPDIFVAGKCIAGGMPTAVWGLREGLAERFAAYDATRPPGHSGMGTTLSGNPMQMACLVAMLSEVMTEAAYAKMEEGAERLAQGLTDTIDRLRAPWHVVRVGARVEFICAPGPLRDGTEAAAAHAPALEALMNLALLNRGCLIAPFHNMMLVSPVTKTRQIDRLCAAFAEIVTELFAPGAEGRRSEEAPAPAVAPKPRRGRPPKTAVVAPRPAEVSEPASPPARRGRPPKAIAPEAEPTPQPARRARPPKADAPEAELALQPVRRGRAAKAVAPEAATRRAATAEPAAPEAEATSPRRRGRPPKLADPGPEAAPPKPRAPRRKPAATTPPDSDPTET